MSDPILQAAGLRKTFRSGPGTIEVLHSASLDIRAGESVSISGPSGSGKTTLLNLLSCLETPEAGTLRWEGAEPMALSAGERARRRSRFMGLVFQAYYLVPELDAFENVVLAGRIAGTAPAAAREAARGLLGRVGLDGRGHHMPSQLSGGERQRAAIARALINRPQVILADEPTGNLDEATGAGVIELLLSLCREHQAALVLVTHNPDFAALCDRRLHLHQGLLA